MIRTEAQLRALYGAPSERAVGKQLAQLDAHCLRFISLSPLCVMATVGAAGSLADASPRGGAPGFIRAPDAHTLLIPDAGGNNRIDSLCNMLHDPRVGLVLLVPGVNEVLRINGTAQLRDEPKFTAAFAGERFVPKLVVQVRVREAYLHCAKALMRSRLWLPEAQVPRTALPPMNQMIHDHMGLGAPTETQAQMEQRYRDAIAAERQPAQCGD